MCSCSEMEVGNLKGSDKPVIAWRVLGEKANTSRFAAHAGTLTGFVGRDQEIALLPIAGNWPAKAKAKSCLPERPESANRALSKRFAGSSRKTPHIAMHYQCSPYHVDSALYPVIAELEPQRNCIGRPTYRAARKTRALVEEGNHSRTTIPLIAALFQFHLAIAIRRLT